MYRSFWLSGEGRFSFAFGLKSLARVCFDEWEISQLIIIAFLLIFCHNTILFSFDFFSLNRVLIFLTFKLTLFGFHENSMTQFSERFEFCAFLTLTLPLSPRNPDGDFWFRYTPPSAVSHVLVLFRAFVALYSLWLLFGALIF